MDDIIDNKFITTDSGVKASYTGASEDDIKKIFRDEYAAYYIIAKAFESEEGKKFLDLLKKQMDIETPFDPARIAQLGIDGANATSYAMAGQHTMIKKFIAAIKIVDEYKTAEAYANAKLLTIKGTTQ